jgi:hypothetical protein
MAQHMSARCFEICVLLAMVLAVQYPSNGSAEDRSPLRLLRDASGHAAQIDNDSVKRTAFLSIIAAQQKFGDEMGAMKTAELESLPGNRDNAWATVIAIQAKNGNIQGATQTLARITEKIARANALAAIAVAYAGAGDIPKALERAGEIPDTYYAYRDAFLRIAAVQAKAGDVPGALRTVEDQWFFNPYGLIPIVQAQLTGGSIDQVIQLTTLIDDQYLKSYVLWALVSQITNRDRQTDIAAIIPVEGGQGLSV